MMYMILMVEHTPLMEEFNAIWKIKVQQLKGGEYVLYRNFGEVYAPFQQEQKHLFLD